MSDDMRHRMEWHTFTPEDEQFIVELGERVDSASLDRMVEELYSHFQTQEETRGHLQDPARLSRLKRAQVGYFRTLYGGRYDEAYFESRKRVGATHARIGLEPKWYLGAYAKYLTLLVQHTIVPWLEEEGASDGRRALTAFLGLVKLALFDITVATEAYIDSAFQRRIAEQRRTIEELSTPVLRIWDGVLVMPLLGSLDDKRAEHATEALLRAINQQGARVALLDVTGMPVVDTHVAGHLMRAVNAAKLLGCEAILTGISPRFAQTLVELDVDMGTVVTRGSLADGLRHALRVLGYRVGRAAAPSM